jgi:hypothetical protein
MVTFAKVLVHSVMASVDAVVSTIQQATQEHEELPL